MLIRTVALYLAAVSLSSGSPTAFFPGINESVSRYLAFLRQDRKTEVCHAQNMEIDVPREDCQTKNKIDMLGHCKDAIPEWPSEDGADCTAYCEDSITPRWGQEVPFDDGMCMDGEKCVLMTGTTITVTRTWEINGGLNIGIRSGPLQDKTEVDSPATALGPRDDDKGRKLTAAFDAGASYTFSKSVAYSVVKTQEEELNDEKCGYWTFVPRLAESCGTLTTAKLITQYGGNQGANWGSRRLCDKTQLQSQYGWCNTTPFEGENGKAFGDQFFVLVDCGTGKLLPMDQQEEVYQRPGVSTGPNSKTKLVRRFRT